MYFGVDFGDGKIAKVAWTFSNFDRLFTDVTTVTESDLRHFSDLANIFKQLNFWNEFCKRPSLIGKALIMVFWKH